MKKKRTIKDQVGQGLSSVVLENDFTSLLPIRSCHVHVDRLCERVLVLSAAVCSVNNIPRMHTSAKHIAKQ